MPRSCGPLFERQERESGGDFRGKRLSGGLLLGAAFLAGLLPSWGKEAPAFVVGVNVHFTRTALAGQAALHSEAAAAGLTGLREDCPWAKVEASPGAYAIPGASDLEVDLARQNGVEPLLVLCYGNALYDGGSYPVTPATVEAYARYCEFVAGHFQGRVRRFEVWNEWEDGTGMNRFGTGKPADYAALLKVVYPRIKKAAPDAEVIAQFGAWGGEGPERELLGRLEKAGWRRFCDAVSIHPYVWNRGDVRNTPEAWIGEVDAFCDRLASLPGKQVPVYITEAGWPSHAGMFGLAPEAQAAFAARALLLSRTVPALRGVWWYDLIDDGTARADPEQNYGLLRADGSRKPLFAALRDVAPLVRDGVVTRTFVDPKGRLRMIRFRLPDGGDVCAFWAPGPDRAVGVALRRAAADGGSLEAVRVGEGAPHPLAWTPVGKNLWACNLVVGPVPVVVSGDLAGCAFRTMPKGQTP